MIKCCTPDNVELESYVKAEKFEKQFKTCKLTIPLIKKVNHNSLLFQSLFHRTILKAIILIPIPYCLLPYYSRSST